MDSAQATALCQRFDLGELLEEPQSVIGGLLHTLWCLVTTRGSFAVKVLNPAIMRRPGIAETYLLSERIAAEFAARGIPAVPALAAADGPLQTISGAQVLVYPWIEGEVLPFEAAPPECARVIGRILSEIHACQLALPELALPEQIHFVDDDWDMLTFHAADQGLPWAYPVRAAMQRLCEWSRWHEQAIARLDQHLVVSHRDLDQKNVIWANSSSPYLIDWEAAGLVNPAMELAGTALSWSGLYVGLPRVETFKALVVSYYETGGMQTASGLDALHGVMGVWLGWLLFNMRRSLGEAASDEQERELGVRETLSTLTILRNLAEHVEIWASWLEIGRGKS